MILYKNQLLGATMNVTQCRIYFWGGIFSQWAECSIYDANLDITFTCAEQAMMYAKALTFLDKEAGEKILTTNDPREQKAIGRTIKNYDDGRWAEVRFDIVKNINYLKFGQNPAWKELLIMTYPYELVEASPYDKVWGVGLGEDNPLILSTENWNGDNLLGQAIMAARDMILKSYRTKD